MHPVIKVESCAIDSGRSSLCDDSQSARYSKADIEELDEPSSERQAGWCGHQADECRADGVGAIESLTQVDITHESHNHAVDISVIHRGESNFPCLLSGFSSF